MADGDGPTPTRRGEVAARGDALQRAEAGRQRLRAALAEQRDEYEHRERALRAELAAARASGTNSEGDGNSALDLMHASVVRWRVDSEGMRSQELAAVRSALHSADTVVTEQQALIRMLRAEVSAHRLSGRQRPKPPPRTPSSAAHTPRTYPSPPGSVTRRATPSSAASPWNLFADATSDEGVRALQAREMRSGCARERSGADGCARFAGVAAHGGRRAVAHGGGECGAET